MQSKHLTYEVSLDGSTTVHSLCGRRVMATNTEQRVVFVEVTCLSCRRIHLDNLRSEWEREELEEMRAHG